MKDTVESSLTIGEIARRCGCPVHRVEYVIRTRGIQPSARAGNARIFSADDLVFIDQTLGEIAQRSAWSRPAQSGSRPASQSARKAPSGTLGTSFETTELEEGECTQGVSDAS